MVIEYAIEYSLSLGENVRTVVSTDITKVMDFCEQRNIEFIKRRSELCADECRIDAALADAIGKKIEEIPEIIECHYTTGNWSVFIKILCHDNEHLMELIKNKIQTIDGISRTETFISLQQQIIRQINL